MKAFHMSEVAYKEFLKFLSESNVQSKTIRINLAGHG